MSDLQQVVLDPAEHTQEDFDVVRRLLEADPVYINLRTKLRLILTELIHPLGFHAWANMRQFDRASGRLIETGWQVCLYCTKTRK